MNFPSSTDDHSFDSAHQVALDGIIPEGILLSASPDSEQEAEVKNQLKYTLGYFNNLEGGVQLPDLKVQLLGRERLPHGLTRIRYSAQLLISWSRGRQIPSQLQLILPEKVDDASIETYFQTYGTSCVSENDATVAGFWYFYRPLSCSLRSPRAGDLAVRFPISLRLSAINTEGKAPEYGKIWEDGELTATFVVGKYSSGATSTEDVGIQNYNAIYSGLFSTFGQPVAVSPAINGLPGAQYPEMHLTFNLSQNRRAVIHLLLVDELSSVGAEFKAKYSRLTEVSDLVIYNGHSGLGANIANLNRMGRFKAGKYQIFMINGCDSLSYADHTLFEAHQRVNPAYAPTKYLDVIINAMPAYFNQMAHASLQLLSATLGSQKTYRQILAQVDPSQKAIVIGEEDNQWPETFGAP